MAIIFLKELLTVQSIYNCHISKCRRNNISLIAHDNVTIDKCIIEDSGTIQGVNPQAGIDIEPEKSGISKNVTIKNSSIKNSQGEYAVSCGAKGSDLIVVDNCLFENNKSFSLNFNNTTGYVNTNTSIKNNLFVGSGKSAIRAAGKSLDVIDNNIFKSNLYAIQCHDVDGLSISNNKILSNVMGGIYAESFINLNIDNNFFENNSSKQAENALLGYAVNSIAKDISSTLKCSNNTVINSITKLEKQRGFKVDTTCNSFSSGNVFKNLFNNIQYNQNFKYNYSNISLDAENIYRNITSDMNFTGGGGNLYIGDKKHSYGTTIPTTGVFNKGDIIYNTSPFATSYIGWVCVTGGTPGVWKGFGQIEA